MSNLVTVFESSDLVLLSMAKAALDEAGIRYVVENELTQDLFGLGRLGSGFSVVTGPPRLRVLPESAERAAAVLADSVGLDG
jgi:hypothetical protein